MEMGSSNCVYKQSIMKRLYHDDFDTLHALRKLSKKHVHVAGGSPLLCLIDYVIISDLRDLRYTRAMRGANY